MSGERKQDLDYRFVPTTVCFELSIADCHRTKPLN